MSWSYMRSCRGLSTSASPLFLGCNLKWEEFTDSNILLTAHARPQTPKPYLPNFERLSNSPISYSEIPEGWACTISGKKKQIPTCLSFLRSWPTVLHRIVSLAQQCLQIDDFNILCSCSSYPQTEDLSKLFGLALLEAEIQVEMFMQGCQGSGRLLHYVSPLLMTTAH